MKHEKKGCNDFLVVKDPEIKFYKSRGLMYVCSCVSLVALLLFKILIDIDSCIGMNIVAFIIKRETFIEDYNFFLL